MRGIAVVVLLAPLAAAGDVSVADAGDGCLGAVRRALAADYPKDTPDERYCVRDEDGALRCRGDCDDRSCHDDACESWTTWLEVSVAHEDGRLVGRVAAASLEHCDFAAEYAADVRRQSARARRVLQACLRGGR